MIEAVHLTKAYGPHIAVDGLTFTIREGQVYGFLGPNGAGKTTTMNMLTGYLAPTSGTVLVNGHDIVKEPRAAKQGIGYLPENPPLYPDLTVKEYLSFAAELRGMKRNERSSAVNRVLKDLEITDVANRLIRVLSKGYRQRVGFAQALITDPETIILDEPTVGLDPKQITEIRALIKKLGKTHTVLLSSHILPEVSEICDTVMILSGGKMAAIGAPKELTRDRNKKTVSLLTDAGEAKIRAALSGIVSAPDLTFRKEQDSTRCTVTVHGDAKKAAGAISAALYSAGCGVYEIRTEEASLEDIFLSMTQKRDETSGEEGV